jgi:hypothetical protein
VPQVRTSVPGPNKTGDPDFLHGAPPTSSCAAFIKESRMEFANANKVYRKSGGSPQSLSLNCHTWAGGSRWRVGRGMRENSYEKHHVSRAS